MTRDAEDVALQFRSAMRRLASTVTIVTTCDGKNIFGMTASAVTSLAMDPPSLLVCVNKSTTFHQAITANEIFCVNILRTGHDEVSTAFGGARPSAEKFAIGDWLSDRETPYLKDAQASIFCNRANLFEHGTHTIVIGNVTDLILTDPVSPLVYVNGRYVSISDGL
jgi:flavin reductase (DIM6/NTAB) family NADH-FMN oxidoreductase RutF